MREELANGQKASIITNYDTMDYRLSWYKINDNECREACGYIRVACHSSIAKIIGVSGNLSSPVYPIGPNDAKRLSILEELPVLFLFDKFKYFLEMTPFDSRPSLRVYGDQYKGGFCDFAINHCDLAIQVIDESASFYLSDEGYDHYIDYASEYAGHKAPLSEREELYLRINTCCKLMYGLLIDPDYHHLSDLLDQHSYKIAIRHLTSYHDAFGVINVNRYNELLAEANIVLQTLEVKEKELNQNV